MINSFDFFKNVPNKKFRIALCISGESRNAMYSFPYIYETFIRSNDIFETDVYIHTRSTYRALHLYEAKKYVIDRSFEGQIFADTFSQEKLSTFPKELRQEFESITKYAFNSNSLKNQIILWDGILKAFNLAFEFPKYDLYIRLRPDIVFKSQFNLYGIINDILVLKKYNIFVPNHWYSKNKKYDDTFAIGDYKSMMYYAFLFNHYISLVSECNTFHSESILFNYLNRNNNIKVGGHDADISIIRKVNPLLTMAHPFYLNENEIYEQ
jgi:hypothetical protein